MAQITQLAMYTDEELAGRVAAMAKAQERSISQTLVGMVREYLELEPIRNVLEARERGLITHDAAMDRLAVLIERDGNGA